VSLDELEAFGQAGGHTLAGMKDVLDAGGQECDVMASSPRTATQFSDCATAGADIVCLSPDTLRSLIVHPLTDRGVDRFLNDLSRRPKGRPSS